MKNKQYIGIAMIIVFALFGTTKLTHAEVSEGSESGSFGATTSLGGTHADIQIGEEGNDDSGRTGTGEGDDGAVRGIKNTTTLNLSHTTANEQERSGDTERSQFPTLKIKIGSKEETKLSKKDVVNGRFDWATTALNNLYTRLTTLTANLKTAGNDVTAPESLLVTAKAKIDIAVSSSTELKNFIASVKGADTVPGTAKTKISTTDATKIKSLAKKAKDDLLAARSALQDVIASLKDIIGTSVVGARGMLRINSGGAQEGPITNPDGTIHVQNQ